MAIQDIPNEMKTNILNEAVRATGMKVPMKKVRFPPTGGIQQEVTLVCEMDFPVDPRSKDSKGKHDKLGIMNIGFQAGKENTINGNIADAILNDPRYSRFFKVVKVNGELVKDGLVESKESEMAKRIIADLEEKYDLVPKKKDDQNNRARPDEAVQAKAATPYQKK